MLSSKKLGGGGKRSPVEHIVRLSNALKTNQMRFIYVSLPLKLSVYPELAARDSTFLMGASTLPQFRQMYLELLQEGVEVIDVFPTFMKAKQDSSIPLFDLTHNISQEGARIVAQAVADHIKETTDFAPNENLQALKETAKQTILKDKKPYIVKNNLDSPFCIFGNCNLQAFHEKGSGIASNLAFYLQHNIDYLGRKLIFWGGESENFDKETFQECCKREIAICISFLAGSFVRTSAIHGKTKKKMLWDILRGKQKLTRKWSTLTLEP